MNYTPNTFLSKINGHSFSSEDKLVRYFETIAPAIFEINKTRVVKELRTTSFDGSLSNLADLVILDNFDRNQAIVAFEFKIDRSITSYKGGSYDDARNQLHKYCQDLNVPYGVLISDKICEIYKYIYRGSFFSSEKVFSLPSLEEIEKEIKTKNKQVEKNVVLFISKLLTTVFLLLIIGIVGFKIYSKNSSLLSIYNCTSIKGNISLKKDNTINEKIYHLPGSKYYKNINLKESEGDRCFSTEKEAVDAGFRKSKVF